MYKYVIYVVYLPIISYRVFKGSLSLCVINNLVQLVPAVSITSVFDTYTVI